MMEKSKRPMATTPMATTVGDGPFAVVKCDCNAKGCRAWQVLSDKVVVAVTQHEGVAAQVASALMWTYHPAATHVAH